MIKFKRGNLIIKAEGQREWMQSHIQVPYVYEMSDRIRVFFTTRPRPKDGQYNAVTAYMDLNKKEPFDLLSISEEPIISNGKPGLFDEFGIMPGPIIKMKNEWWMYYEGWSRSQSVPYNHAIGIAITSDFTYFRKLSDGPVLSDCMEEPYRLYSVVGDIIRKEGQYHMFYGSGLGWKKHQDRMESVYLIKHAVSIDGLGWKRDKDYMIKPLSDDECQVPSNLLFKNGVWHMFYSYRKTVDFRNSDRGYRIGHAYSEDLLKWNRDDESFAHIFEDGSDGWDNEMKCYPFCIELDGNIYMFYCGNEFGKGGLGYGSIEIC